MDRPPASRANVAIRTVQAYHITQINNIQVNFDFVMQKISFSVSAFTDVT